MGWSNAVGWNGKQGWEKKAAAGGGSFLITAGGSSTNPNSSVTNTFSSLSLPTGNGYGTRRIAVVAGVFGTTISGATIDTGGGPVAMTSVISQAGGTHTVMMFRADIATGTTATIVVTTAAAAGAGINLTYDIINTTTAVPPNTYSADLTADAAVSQAFVIPSGGGGSAGVMATTGGGPGTWTNATSDEIAAVAAGYALDMGQVTGPGTVTVGYTHTNQIFVGATWSP